MFDIALIFMYFYSFSQGDQTMKLSRFAAVCFMSFVLTAAVLTKASYADEIIANNDPNASCSSSSTPPCYPTIQEAIDAAYALNTTQTTSVYSVLVEPGTGTYPENITLKGITVKGREAKTTFIYGSGTDTLVTADQGTAVLSNLTLYGGSIGTSVTGTASLTIENNIYYYNTSSGVDVQAGLATIVNNVFYGNNNAISSSIDSTTIKNNIFLNNYYSLYSSSLSGWNYATYNDFYTNLTDTSNLPINSTTGNISLDPVFVDPASNDFHLQTGSPCIDAGDSSITDNLDATTSDMGAYGGPYSDTIPSMVSDVTASPTTDTIDVTWTATTDYRVIGYNVYYGSASGVYDGTGATEGDSPITISDASSASATISGLSTAISSVLSAPTMSIPSVGDKQLNVGWNSVTGATGYKVYIGTEEPTITPLTEYIDVGLATSVTLTQLPDGTPFVNGTWYYVGVSAYAQATYYIAVTALYSSSTYSPGIEYESAYSAETSASLGTGVESEMSTIVSDYPEPIVGYPDLPNTKQGCFVATAAYGFYSAPQVQALRVFRDRYLKTNMLGNAFVRWYYQHGPVAAAWLEAHPAWKPAVRAALLPAVGMALFLTRTPAVVLGILFLFLIMLSVALIARRFRSAH